MGSLCRAALAAGLLTALACLRAWAGTAAFALPEVYRQDPFLAQVLLQAVAADFTGEGRSQLAISGRNYERQEVFVYIVRWSGQRFMPVWRSGNLWEPASHVAIAAGDFTGSGRAQLAVLTRTRLLLFEWQDGKMAVVHEQAGPGAPEEIGVARHPEHPHDLLAISRQHGVEGDIPQKSIELWGYRRGRFRPLWETPAIGRVRAVTGADVTGDGVWELLVEVGELVRPGTVQVWQWRSGRYALLISEPLRPAVAFGLAAAGSDAGPVVVVADNRGRSAAYRLNGGFELLGESGSLGWGVTSAAVADFFGDGGLQAAVIGYPSRLHLLAVTGSP
ncbi:MAG: hypothetical protein H0Z37_06200 [Firmicutes bacterium]|nr:hypothetical protein [Bacillota bacterium]